MPTKKPTPPTPPIMKRCNFFMSPGMVDGLAKVAEKKEVPSAEIVRLAVASYLKRHGIEV